MGRRRPYAGTEATPYILVFFTGPFSLGLTYVNPLVVSLGA